MTKVSAAVRTINIRLLMERRILGLPNMRRSAVDRRLCSIFRRLLASNTDSLQRGTLSHCHKTWTVARSSPLSQQMNSGEGAGEQLQRSQGIYVKGRMCLGRTEVDLVSFQGLCCSKKFRLMWFLRFDLVSCYNRSTTVVDHTPPQGQLQRHGPLTCCHC